MFPLAHKYDVIDVLETQ